MKIEYAKPNNNLKPGCIIIDKNNIAYLITENELDPPCRCSEHMGEGYVLIKLNGHTNEAIPVAWSVFTKLEGIEEDMSIAKVIQPENILIKEL